MDHKEWIRTEIAAWRAEGVIDDSLATQLLDRYPSHAKRHLWGAAIAGAFGALLIGLGLIAIFAANWQCFGRNERAAIAMAPVLFCGALAILATRKEWRSNAFWEPLGILWCIATGAAVCLISQTYQIDNSVPGLVLLVALLTLPVVWVARSIMTMALWPLFALVWSGSMQDACRDQSGVIILVQSLALLALSIPACIAFHRRTLNKTEKAMGQCLSGLVYAMVLPSLIASCLDLDLFEANVGIFWGCSLLILLLGILFKIPSWPFVACFIASCTAIPTVFDSPVCYGISIGMAIAIIAYGTRHLTLRYTNVGTVLLLWLVLAKYCESSISFTLKGIIFINAGAALTALNIVMVKCKKKEASK